MGKGWNRYAQASNDDCTCRSVLCLHSEAACCECKSAGLAAAASLCLSAAVALTSLCILSLIDEERHLVLLRIIRHSRAAERLELSADNSSGRDAGWQSRGVAGSLLSSPVT